MEVKKETEVVDHTHDTENLLKINAEENIETFEEHKFQIKLENKDTDSYVSENLLKIEENQLNAIEEDELQIKDDIENNTEEEPPEIYEKYANNYQPNESQGVLQSSDSQAKLYACGMCPFQTCLQDWLENHYRFVHSNSIEVKFKKLKWNPNKYLITRIGTDIHQCEYCTYYTKYKGVLRKHCESHHSRRETAYKCDHCDFKTKKLHYLENHLTRYKVNDETETFACENCTFITKYRCSLLSHGKNHKGKSGKPSIGCKMYRCADCDYVTKYKEHLESHVLTHKMLSEIPMLKCTECFFETKYVYSLRLHETINHTKKYVEIQQTSIDNQPNKTHRQDCVEEKPTVQKTCNKRQVRTEIQKNSPRLKRAAPCKEYRCSDCEYGTKYVSNLRVHLLGHKDAYIKIIFKCVNCPFESMNKSSVTQHDKQIHTY